MIETENIVVAIGVCSALATEAYNINLDTQPGEWHSLRSAVYHLTEALERQAVKDVAAPEGMRNADHTS